MSDISVAELLIGRKLRQEPYNGTRRYTPGQAKAKRFVTGTDAVVSYVDRDGCLCLIVAELADDEWVARDLLIRVGLNHAEVRTLPRSARLPDEVVRALQASGRKQPRPPVGQTT